MKEDVRIGFWDIIRSQGTARLRFIKLVDHLAGGLAARLVRGRRIVVTPLIAPDSILVIRPGGIGDAVFLLPVLKAVRRRHPAARLSVLCERRNRAVLASQKGLCDEVVCWDDGGALRTLFRKRFDVVVDTEQWHYASALTAYFLKSDFRVGFESRPLRAKLFEHRAGYRQDEYELNNFRNLFAFLLEGTERLDNINYAFDVPEEDQEWALRRPVRTCVTLGLGGSVPARRLTDDQVKTIAGFVLEKGYHAVFLGGGEAAAQAGAVCGALKDERAHNYAGRTTLTQTAALIERSRLFVGADSGIMHLACAVGKPAVALFGPGNRKKWGPRGDMHAILSTKEKCSPCTYFGYTVVSCRENCHCMRHLDMDEVLGAVARKLWAG